MNNQVKILLQTTIPFDENDWHTGRFSLLTDHLRSLTDADGRDLYDVSIRNREQDAEGNDPVLTSLHESDFDQLWLFALDMGDGLSKTDCEGITKFRQRGGGILATRDHNDMGCSLCTLGGIGAAHFFHSKQTDPDESRRSLLHGYVSGDAAAWLHAHVRAHVVASKHQRPAERGLS